VEGVTPVASKGMVERGLLDALDRILQQLIDTPKFKDSVMILLKAVDPPSARRLVRTLLWRDPGFSMSIMGTLPELLNAFSHAAAELSSQLGSLPPPLLRELLARVLGNLDGEALGEAVARLLQLGPALSSPGAEDPLRESLTRLSGDFSRSLAAHLEGSSLKEWLSTAMAKAAERARDEGSFLHAFIRDFREAVAENPDFAKYVMKPLLGSAPGPSRGRSSRAHDAGGEKGESRKRE